MRPRFMISLAGLLTALIVLAGCGGGSSSSTTAASGTSTTQGAALTKSEFVTQANTICANGNKLSNVAAKRAFPKGQQPSQAEQEKFITDTVIPDIQGQIHAIEALSPPSGDEDQVNAITDAAQSALDKVKADPSLITQQSQTDPFAQANKLANAYGLTKCGS